MSCVQPQHEKYKPAYKPSKLGNISVHTAPLHEKRSRSASTLFLERRKLLLILRDIRRSTKTLGSFSDSSIFISFGKYHRAEQQLLITQIDVESKFYFKRITSGSCLRISKRRHGDEARTERSITAVCAAVLSGVHEILINIFYLYHV